MRLEHLNLVVNNINASLDFYRQAFPHWTIRGQGEATWSGKPRRWLHFGDHDQYLAFNDNGEGAARDLGGHQPGLAHFAFVVTNIQAVEQRLNEAGFLRAKDGQADAYRSNAYYLDPNGFEVEFVEYHSDLPEQRNRYDT